MVIAGMVNTGRPSRACDPCKARHTKCDERRPQCARCERSGRQCTGYKNDIDINLRNETRIAARRVHARKAQRQSLQNAMAPPYEQQAIAVVLENFVLDAPNAGFSRGYLAGLSPLLQLTASNSLLTSTLEAVGLCFLAKKMSNESMALRAARTYSRSLRHLQAVLDRGVNCISIETTMSVYLMGLYEMITPPAKTVHPWLAHLQGLTAIIKARKEKNGSCFPDIDCLISLDRVLGRSPWASAGEWFSDHSDHSEGMLNIENIMQGAQDSHLLVAGRYIGGLLDDLMLRTQPILQVAPYLSKNSEPGAKADVQRLLIAARSQLSNLRVWPSTIPDHLQPKPVHCDIDTSETLRVDMFPGRVDMYPDLCVAAIWNTYRTTLLRLCDLIVQCGNYLETEAEPFRETEEYQTLRGEARETSEAICSSVAYHITNEWFNRTTTASLHKSPKALGGLLLIWPLYGGSILSIVPKAHRAWMRRKLQLIGTTAGLAQATVLADTVDLWDSTDPFKPLIISQGHAFMWIASMF